MEEPLPDPKHSKGIRLSLLPKLVNQGCDPSFISKVFRTILFVWSAAPIRDRAKLCFTRFISEIEHDTFPMVGAS